MATPSTHLPNSHQKALHPPQDGDFRAENIKSSPTTGLDAQFQQWLLRHEQEIESVRQRSKVNLLIGVFAMVLATGILAPAVLLEPAPSSWVEGSIHLLPRLTLSLFIGTFSTFFLRLYNAGAHEIRYYRNELTNIHLQLFALSRAGDNVSRGIVIKAMSITERNPILKEGQTTDELERLKIELRNQSQELATFLRALKQKG